MNRQTILTLLEQVRAGDMTVDEACRELADYPFKDLGHTRFDTQRELRSGFGEVVYAGGKSIEELEDIVVAALASEGRVLLTRMTAAQGEKLTKTFTALSYYPRSGTAHIGEPAPKVFGRIGVVTAGTSDRAVAEEVTVCAEFFGLLPSLITDVGIAGLPRLLSELPRLQEQDILVVIAGMEGALPSVVAGLSVVPVIAVPTSVGYGATMNGLTPLLSMLVSCSPGLTVVNIDNGFGAALAAAKIIRHLSGSTSGQRLRNK